MSARFLPKMGLEFTSSDVEPGGNRASSRQDLVIGRNVDQVVLDAGAESLQRVFAVGSKRCSRQNNAGAAGVRDTGQNTGELLGRCLVALVDEDHPSPFAEAVEGAQEFLVIELVDEGHVRGGDHIRVERVPNHRVLADDLVLGDVEGGLSAFHCRNALELGIVLAQEADIGMKDENGLSYVNRVLGCPSCQEAFPAASRREDRARAPTANCLSDRCGDPGLIGLGLLVADPSAEFRNGGLRHGIGSIGDWPHWSKI